jgi:trk system potassium uptake protein
MAVEIASHLYGVRRTVARLFNPERERSYQKLGVRYVSATGFLAQQFMNEFREGTFRQHLMFEHGDVQVVELRLGEKAHGTTVEDLEHDRRLRVCALQRGEVVHIPLPQDRLEEGDLVVAAARRGIHRAVREFVVDERHARRYDPSSEEG